MGAFYVRVLRHCTQIHPYWKIRLGLKTRSTGQMESDKMIYFVFLCMDMCCKASSSSAVAMGLYVGGQQFEYSVVEVY